MITNRTLAIAAFISCWAIAVTRAEDEPAAEPVSALSAAKDEMPDIAGVWRLANDNSRDSYMKITPAGGTEKFQFLLQQKDKYPSQLRWVPEDQVFEWRQGVGDKLNEVNLMRVSADAKSMSLLRFFEPVARKALLERLNRSNATPEELKADIVNEMHFVDRIQGGDFVVIETKDGLNAYSEKLAAWSRLDIQRPKDGSQRITELTVSNHFATVVIDDQLLGYSSQAGRWGKMTIPPELVGEVAPVHSQNLVTATVGDKTYALSPKTGEWTSPGEESSPPAISKKGGAPLASGDESIGRRKNSGDVLLFYSNDDVFSLQMVKRCMELQRRVARPPIHFFDVNDRAKQASMAEIFEITQVPTFVVRLDGRAALREFGVQTRDRIEEYLEMARTGTSSDVAAIAEQGEKALIKEVEAQRVAPRRRLFSTPPAAQKLSEEIALHEAEAVELAKQIRNRSGNVGDKHPQQVKDRKKLQNALAAALELKFELEQLQVQDLQGRLSRLEQQIGQRKAQRQKIIDRRAEELIEGEATRWDTNHANDDRRLSRSEAQPEVLASPPTNGEQPIISKIQITGPQGMRTLKKNDISGFLPLRIELGHPTQGIVPLELMTAALQKIYGRLRVISAEDDTRFIWKDRELQVHITPEDVEQVTAGKGVTKVFYLSQASLKDQVNAVTEMIDTKQLPAGTDPVNRAAGLGKVLAVFQLSDKPALVSASVSGPSNDPLVSEAPEKFSEYQRLALELVKAQENVQKAETELANEQEMGASNPQQQATKSKELQRLGNQLKSHRQRQKILKDEYRAALRDLELQVQAARAEAELTAKMADVIEAQRQAARATSKDALEAELSRDRAKASLDRLENKLKFYKQAGEGLVDPPRHDGTRPLSSVPETETRPALDAAAKVIWDHLGMKLTPLPESEQHLVGPKYRGGMRVVEVRENSPFAGSGVRKDDILVSLGKWEMTSPENVAWILTQPEFKTERKFGLIRGQETLSGHVQRDEDAGK